MTVDDGPEIVYSYPLSPRIELLREPLGNDRYLHWIELQGGIPGVVIVVTDGASVLLQRQWRRAVGAWVWQFPRGNGETADARLDAARELEEETGISSAHLTPIGRVLPDPGILSTAVSVVEARVEFLDVSTLHTSDENELIDTFEAVGVSALDSWIARGDLCDGITLAALQVWRSHIAVE